MDDLEKELVQLETSDAITSWIAHKLGMVVLTSDHKDEVIVTWFCERPDIKTKEWRIEFFYDKRPSKRVAVFAILNAIEELAKEGRPLKLVKYERAVELVDEWLMPKDDDKDDT